MKVSHFFSWLWNTQDQFTLPRGHSCWVTLKPESCGDEKVLPLSPRRQDKRGERVHSHELPTAELTPRSGWVRIIHAVQTFVVTIRKTAGPGPFFLPILRHSTRLARADSTSWNGHSPHHQPQSQTVYCYLRLTPSMGALTLSDDCRVTAKAYVRAFYRTSGCEKSSCWWYVPGRMLNLRGWSLVMQVHAGWRDRCEAGRKVKQNNADVLGRKTTNHTVKHNATHFTFWSDVQGFHPAPLSPIVCFDHLGEHPQFSHHISTSCWIPAMQKLS